MAVKSDMETKVRVWINNCISNAYRVVFLKFDDQEFPSRIRITHNEHFKELKGPLQDHYSNNLWTRF